MGHLEPAVFNYIAKFVPRNPNAYVAQCGECLPTEREVASSNPGVDIKMFFSFFRHFVFFFLLRNHLPKGNVFLSVSWVKKNRLEP